jgi:hypothetical protein
MPEAERALRIGVDNHATVAGLLGKRGKVGCQSAFARPTLSRRHRNDVHA